MTDSTSPDSTSADATAPAATASGSGMPWIDALNAFHAKAAEISASGSGFPRRFDELIASTSWPLHTIETDEGLAVDAGAFLERFAQKSLVPAMNVFLKKRSARHFGSIFGYDGLAIASGYLQEEAEHQQKLAKASTSEAPAPASGDSSQPPSSSGPSALDAQATIDALAPDDATSSEIDQVNSAITQEQPEVLWPAAQIIPEPEAWIRAGQKAKALCDRFGLRCVNAPLSMRAADAEAFLDRLESGLSELASFLQTEERLLGLDRWLGFRARSPGSIEHQKQTAGVEDSAAQAKKEQEDAKKKEKDKEHGMFSGGFIQIEISPEFKPVVLAHEWFHSMDLWFGSKDIVKAQPWQDWRFFASQIAFADSRSASKLREWSQILTHGGSKKLDFMDAGTAHPFLSQMRDPEFLPDEELVAPMADVNRQRLLKLLEGVSLDPSVAEQTQAQATAFGEALAAASKEHAQDHIDSPMGLRQQWKRRKDFLDEWGDLAAMWAKRQSGLTDPDKIKALEGQAKMVAARSLAGAYRWAISSRMAPSPNDQMAQAMRMDQLSGNSLQPYFCTPHEMLAYTLETLFLSKTLEPDPVADPAAAALSAWLRQEVVPQLAHDSSASLSALFNVKPR